MSWSVYGVGKPEAVAKRIEEQFTQQSPCAEPEETIRQSARATIAASLAGQRPDMVIQVQAGGCMQSTYDQGTYGPPFQNSLNIDIKPIPGFVE